MKRIILLAVTFLMTAVYASAQYQTYYVVEQLERESPNVYKFQIDWNNKLFFLEGDKHNDGPIKKYKENGNTRSFDVYYDPSSGLNELVFSVVFTTEAEDSFTLSTTYEGFKQTYKLSTTEPVDEDEEAAEAAEAAPAATSVNDKISAKTKSVKDAIGKGVAKGLDALKKKGKGDKAGK